MLTALVSTGTSYTITSLVARYTSVNTVGAWQAAMTLSGVMTSFVLGSMATDYFPRMSAIATDPEKVKAEVNAQTEVSLLLATPALVGIYALASPIILLLYSPEFTAAVDLLRIAALGVYFRVISYPLGYVVLAKGRGRLFLGIELGHNLFYIATAFAGITAAGIVGVAWAFVAVNALTIAVNGAVARRLCRFRWSHENLLHLLVTSVFMLLIAFVSRLEIAWAQIFLAVVAIAGSGTYSYLMVKRKC
jgi:PST family polysaccharide transporter